MHSTEASLRFSGLQGVPAHYIHITPVTSSENVRLISKYEAKNLGQDLTVMIIEVWHHNPTIIMFEETEKNLDIRPQDPVSKSRECGTLLLYYI
jgi:hypothetical protein